ncbi:MAG: GAF domain-containing protein [Nitrospirota bacterium]|nr:GAF domain-containing protein [Nitrospirota bacterium]MDH5768208.1 GAF domain-containing protein [Nitrospirota bacterium]
MEKEGNITKKADEFLQIFKKGEEFTKELLKENERLRFKIAQLEEAMEQSRNEGKVRLYEERIQMLEKEHNSLLEKYRQVEEENKDFASKYIEVETENNNLANLYVASYQLHSTLDFNEVLRIVLEIVINLIGAEEFAVFLMDDKSNELVPVASEGLSISDIPKIKTGEGIIGTVAREGEGYFSENISRASEVDARSPIVCIPLKIKEHVIGVISIYTLFVQKTSFSNVDYELFNLLAGHAATAIFSSKLYTQSERKLTTIQSFLDLLKEKPKR